METQDFSPNNGDYSAIESFFEVTNSASGNDASEIIILDGTEFELPPYDVMIDEFYQEPESSTKNRILPPQNSAFSAYNKVYSNAVADSLLYSESLHKKCLRFLGKIDEERKLKVQRSTPTAPAPASTGNKNQELNAKSKNRGKSAFRHMIAERNRRVQLREHFENLYSLLPRSCRKDKHSILSNTTSYLRELKLRAGKLKQQNEGADESIPLNFSNIGGGDRFESQEKSFNLDSPLLYHSVDVILEQCKDNPCQVKIIINVQMKMVSCSASLLLRVIELLRAERLEILWLSHNRGFGFQAIFIVLPKDQGWDICHWQTFGSLVSQTLN
ncbi:uncharacterized protein LOC131027495 isoform X1 [Cryptomeria japonica]|uniref:uncharacterized protein LOC131027495 isoform X1 n=2 Tax=Cryptomeria japonica TaxID=3369 RepID=UPI0025AB72D0|nr:uncharacterized protein LOC131027495 isoform X1 [Cryptomeria japonica]XP_057813564.1 uncharacterized protein LOC131027495 isoform X1 [Cryptomeria japonica]